MELGFGFAVPIKNNKTIKMKNRLTSWAANWVAKTGFQVVKKRLEQTNIKEWVQKITPSVWQQEVPLKKNLFALISQSAEKRANSSIWRTVAQEAQFFATSEPPLQSEASFFLLLCKGTVLILVLTFAGSYLFEMDQNWQSLVYFAAVAYAVGSAAKFPVLRRLAKGQVGPASMHFAMNTAYNVGSLALRFVYRFVPILIRAVLPDFPNRSSSITIRNMTIAFAMLWTYFGGFSRLQSQDPWQESLLLTSMLAPVLLTIVQTGASGSHLLSTMLVFYGTVLCLATVFLPNKWKDQLQKHWNWESSMVDVMFWTGMNSLAMAAVFAQQRSWLYIAASIALCSASSMVTMSHTLFSKTSKE